MDQTFALQIISTGETILTGNSNYSLAVWQRKQEKKVLKHKNRAERFKAAVQQHDTIAAWVNYDEFIKTYEGNKPKEISRIFKGYDLWFEFRT